MPDDDRLRTFVDALPREVKAGRSRISLKHVLEFRDERGYLEPVVGLLRASDVALCVHDMNGSQSPRVVTNDLAYVRFHGYGTKYGGSYPTATLEELGVVDGRTVLQQGVDVFAYFNNDIDGHAVRDARRLKSLLAGLDRALTLR